MIYIISYNLAAKTHCGGRPQLRRCAFLSTGNWPRMSWRGEEGAGDTVEGRRDGGERKEGAGLMTWRRGEAASRCRGGERWRRRRRDEESRPGE